MTTIFWLNDERVETDDPHGLLVLDFVRRRGQTGTKEGCKEGDCGACAILVGELDGERVRYQPVTSCLVPLGEVHGKHVVTIEGLNFPRELTPVQQAMVEEGGTQCGYCTPGFVVSMHWFLMDESDDAPTMDGFKRAISGNLCRCTGYTSINRAGRRIVDRLENEWSRVWDAADRVGALVDAELVPSYFSDMAARLTAIEPREEDDDEVDFVVAGGTDLYVQQGEHIPRSRLKLLNRYPEMRGIRVEDGMVHVGALTTFEEFSKHDRMRAMIPRMDDFMWLIASLHIRNRATIAGNIVNASPIGDMTALVLALDSTIVLRDADTMRTVPMTDFFLGYKDLDKRDDEIVTEIVFPWPEDDTRVNLEKVAKRKALDIATVCSGAKIRVVDGTIRTANITMGGVAATPLLLQATGDALVGQPLDEATIRAAQGVAQTEVSPISDVRGSADYKRLLTHQLIAAHFVTLYPDAVNFKKIAS